LGLSKAWAANISRNVISNAIVLGSLQSKGFPQPSTNQTCFTADEDINCPVASLHFFINPDSASLSYTIRHPDMGSSEDIPSDETIVKCAWDCALPLGVTLCKSRRKA